MSHIHIPDGVLPLWLVTAGWAVTLALLYLSARRLSGPEARRKIPLLGVVAASVIITLSISTMMLIGVVALSNVDPGKARDTGALNVTTFSFRNPFGEGLVSNRMINPEKEALGNFYIRDSGVNLGRFAAAVLLLGSIGWVLEAMITAVIVQFIYSVRRELIVGTKVGD